MQFGHPYVADDHCNYLVFHCSMAHDSHALLDSGPDDESGADVKTFMSWVHYVGCGFAYTFMSGLVEII